MSGTVIWFTGLSGAGKSTIAELVGRELEARGDLVDYLDGDVVREHLSRGLGFSKADRDTNIERIGWVASRIARAGATVIVSAISPYAATRATARALVEDAAARFVEVHVATSLEECARRDVKGLYEKAFAGELEAEAVHIMREVAAERERPVLLFSGGKDSIVLLRLAEKAFRPGGFPFPVMHVDTGHNFPEVMAFIARRIDELGEELISAKVEDSIAAGRAREEWDKSKPG